MGPGVIDKPAFGVVVDTMVGRGTFSVGLTSPPPSVTMADLLEESDSMICFTTSSLEGS